MKPLVHRFERAMGEILSRVCVSTVAQPLRIAVAYSGGLDSAVLLRLAAGWAKANGHVLCALHIHHGLSKNADDWDAHCARQAAALGIDFQSRRVVPGEAGGEGVEEAARLARYAALGALCRERAATLLLTAHHQDDQAETVLMQLLRGSGVAGLSGMEAVHAAPSLLGDENLLLARPLLECARAELEDFAAAQAIAHVEDESNADPRFTRNALRLSVMPLLENVAPGFAARVARSAGHLRSARGLLDGLAAQDYAACRDGACLDLARLRVLPSARLDNLLRHWLHEHGVRLPSTAWLQELRAQLLEAGADAQPRILHPDCEIRRHRERIYLLPRAAAAAPAPQAFQWLGEPALDFPGFGGRLLFIEAEEGIDAAWLKARPLVLRHRAGGERLKLAENRPTRSLKHICQERDIPPWERERMVFIETGGALLYASSLGLDYHFAAKGGGARVQIRWEA